MGYNDGDIFINTINKNILIIKQLLPGVKNFDTTDPKIIQLIKLLNNHYDDVKLHELGDNIPQLESDVSYMITRFNTLKKVEQTDYIKAQVAALIDAFRDLARLTGILSDILKGLSKKNKDYGAISIGLFGAIITFLLVKSVIKGVMKYKDVKSYIKNIRYYWKGYLRVLSNPKFYADDINKLIRVGYNMEDALIIISLAKSLPGKERDILHVAKTEYNNFLKNPKIINLKRGNR